MGEASFWVSCCLDVIAIIFVAFLGSRVSHYVPLLNDDLGTLQGDTTIEMN